MLNLPLSKAYLNVFEQGFQVPITEEDKEIAQILLKYGYRTFSAVETTGFKGADLAGADLSGVILRETILNFADLSSTYLGGADFSSARVIGTDFKGAFFNITSLNIEQASQVKSLFNTTGLQDSIKNVLLQSHPQLFIEPGK